MAALVLGSALPAQARGLANHAPQARLMRAPDKLAGSPTSR